MEQQAKVSDTGLSAAGSGIYFCDNPEGISILSRKSIPQEKWAEIRKLQQIDTRYNWKILFFLVQSLVGGLILQSVDNLFVHLVCYFLMACSVVGLPILMHESCHSLLYKKPSLNRWVGFFCGLSGLVSASAYRSIHTTHHANTRTESDPDDIEASAQKSVPMVFAYYFVLVAGIYLYIPTVAMKGFAKANYRMRVNIVTEYVLMIAVYALVFVVFPFDAILKLWLIPLLIAGQFSNVRGLAEHGLMTGGNEFTDSRTVMSNKFVSFMMSNLNYHLEHHLFPGIPNYNLPKVHELLKDHFRQAGASVYPSYTQFLLDFVHLTMKRGITSNMRLIPAQLREEVCA